jgi:hypothetical protein
MSAKRSTLIYVLLILFSLAPFILTLLSLGIAQLNGCSISANDLKPCLVFGQDIGALLLLGAFLGSIHRFHLAHRFNRHVGIQNVHRIQKQIRNRQMSA